MARRAPRERQIEVSGNPTAHVRFLDSRTKRASAKIIEVVVEALGFAGDMPSTASSHIRSHGGSHSTRVRTMASERFMQSHEPPAPLTDLIEHGAGRGSRTNRDLHVVPGDHPEPRLRNVVAIPLAQPAPCIADRAERKLAWQTRIVHRPVQHGMLIERHLVDERHSRSLIAFARAVRAHSVARQHVDRRFVFERSPECRCDRERCKTHADQKAAQ